MKKSIRKNIEYECFIFCEAKKIPEGQRPILLKLAIKSWENLPSKSKHKWSLEQIVVQKL